MIKKKDKRLRSKTAGVVVANDLVVLQLAHGARLDFLLPSRMGSAEHAGFVSISCLVLFARRVIFGI
jgi:hypothetical protein